MACCPEPYKACEVGQRVAGCDDLISPIIGIDGATVGKQEAYKLVQRARGALRDADEKCRGLGEMLPFAECGSETGAAFNRPDIFCEMMLWQSEQLGDGNEAEYKTNGCPWPGSLKFNQARHSGRLSKTQLPDWARNLMKMAPRDEV